MKIKPAYVILAILAILSIVLAYDAFTSYVNPYLTVSQIVENGAAYVNKEVQVLGLVANGSVGWNGSASISFNLTDLKSELAVLYQGPPPQNFNEGQQVVVIGRLVSLYHMDSSQMLVKCPSKYEGQQNSLLTDPIFVIAMVLGGIGLAYFVATTVLKKS